MNKTILVGNLCKDVELKELTSGTKVANFTIACQRRFKNADGQYESDFINCTSWGATSEFINKYFSKGNKIGIVGRIQTRTWEDENGMKHYVTEVVAEEVEFVGSKNNNTTTDTIEATIVEEDDDSLPF